MIVILRSACATVDGVSDKGLDDMVVGRTLLDGGDHGLFVDCVGIELLEN